MKKSYLFAAVTFLFLQKAFTQASFTIEGNLCKNNDLTFIDNSVINASDWNWNFGDGTTSIEQNPTHSYSDTGFFTITMSINSGQFNSSQTKYISGQPIVDFMIDSTKFYFSSYSRIFIDASSSLNPLAHYIWNFGDGSLPLSTDSSAIVYKYTDKGTYNVWLKVIDDENCSDSIFKTIDIHDRYYIPNVFTPNSDKINDEFVVTSNGETLFSIEIYSRWGNLVFKRDGHQQIVWDGRLPDGTLIKPGTYYYVINSETGNVTYDPEKGFITVFY